MIKIFSEIFKWVAWKAVTLLLILAVIVAAIKISDEFKDRKNEYAHLVRQKDVLSKELENLKRTGNTSSDRIPILEEAREKLRVERNRLMDEHPLMSRVPFSEINREIKRKDLEIFSIESALKGRKSTLEWIKKRNNDIEQEIHGIEKKLKESRDSWLSVAYQQLPNAFAVLIALILVPIGIKATLYFIVARWIEGRPPIRLLPSASGRILAVPMEGPAGTDRGKISSVSRPVVLGESQELLIQQGYLQSSSLLAKKKTKWLLNASIPFSSLLSGMFMLIRVSPAGSEPVVISSTKDPLSEVGIIDLADGAALVCQPRSLVGVIQDPRKPIRITRHWRLGSLQSWLTLQLRFLVFHGPGQLIMKGCRGIRIEPPGAGRLINQAATLGFSANIAYANTRCETFASYWAGKEDLFNDLFTGESGVYVYEEIPDARRTTGIARHVEGFMDGILKIFGV